MESHLSSISVFFQRLDGISKAHEPWLTSLLLQLMPIPVHSAFPSLPSFHFHSHCLILALLTACLSNFTFSLHNLSDSWLPDQSPLSLWLYHTAAQNILKSLHSESLSWYLGPHTVFQLYFSLHLFHKICIPARLNYLLSSDLAHSGLFTVLLKICLFWSVFCYLNFQILSFLQNPVYGNFFHHIFPVN